MLYTGKGDDGTTKVFDTEKGKRISKSSAVAEALGACDELNSWLGLCRAQIVDTKFIIGGECFSDILLRAQKDLFIIQAELAGADKTIAPEKVTALETVIAAAEKELPPITTFFIPGTTAESALLDVARTTARRAERRAVSVVESGERALGEHTRKFMNRLSSLFYALARLANHISGIKEDAPDYQ